jgi:hypothetical protein
MLVTWAAYRESLMQNVERPNLLLGHGLLPVVLAFGIALYWLLAFAVALAAELGPASNQSQWWNVAAFREPGLYLADTIFNAMPKWANVGRATVLDWPFLTVLVIVAAGIGAAVFFIAAYLRSWIVRRRLLSSGGVRKN